MSVVVGVDSYISESQLDEYAAKRGIVLVCDASVLLIKSMDYLEAQNFKGQKTDPAQPLQWPRKNAVINGVLVDSSTVPAEVSNAQAVIALSIDSGYNPLDTYGPAIKSEKVDVIEVVYQDNAGSTDYSPAITSALRPLVSSGFSSAFIPVSAAR